MNMQDTLATLPPKEWVVDQVVVFDWYDGPRHGVARLAKPECEFAFDMLEERHNPDGLDLRLFRVNELPTGSVGLVLNAIRCLGAPANKVWVPTRKFESPEDQIQADQEIDRILSQQAPTAIAFCSSDMITFAECWEGDRAGEEVA